MAVTLARLEVDGAVLNVGGQAIKWPIDKLPIDAGEGDIFKLCLMTPQVEDDERQKTARAILSEILKVNET